MFNLIGLGLGDPTDISLYSKEIVKKCDRVYLEAYTSILLNGAKDTLESFHERPILLADRELVEQGADELLSQDEQVALLVVGDPLGATTHTDLMLRAKQDKHLPIKTISNASILSAVGITGLDMARFGEVVSIPFWDDTWKPESFYAKITTNLELGLHTLCLLDIKVKEQTVENLIKGRKIFEPPRFMRTDQAASQLLDIIANCEDIRGGADVDTPCIACVRLGTDKQYNFIGSLQEISSHNLGAPLHSLVICAPLTDIESRNTKALASHFSASDQKNTSSSTGTLHLVGAGMSLGEVTVKGLAAIRSCAANVMLDEDSRQIFAAQAQDSGRLKEMLDTEVINLFESVLDLTNVGYSVAETNKTKELLQKLENGQDVAIVVLGDPLVLSDYNSLLEQVISKGFNFSVVHNTSILNSVALCGLQLYTFGQIVQFPDHSTSNDNLQSFIDDQSSFFNKLLSNCSKGWHTLCLLKCNDRDSSLNYRTPDSAASLLLSIVKLYNSTVTNDGENSVLSADSTVVTVTGIGGSAQGLKSGTLAAVAKHSFAVTQSPVCALIVAGKMHPLELDCLSALTESVTEGQ